MANNGNRPDRFDFRLTTVIDPTGIPVGADYKNRSLGYSNPKESLEELDHDSDQTFDVLMNMQSSISVQDYMLLNSRPCRRSISNEQNRITRGGM
ncbi:MAG: hypothetical protein CM15mP47_1160 [Methanobacteriota archaeon]|nr:MAG: hypothetical protein CM15mP47_1160 [Euryarchaeota archaeon]